jgi:hypothetical protein
MKETFYTWSIRLTLTGGKPGVVEEWGLFQLTTVHEVNLNILQYLNMLQWRKLSQFIRNGSFMIWPVPYISSFDIVGH